MLPLVVVAGRRTLDPVSFGRLLRSTGRLFAVGSLIAWSVLGITGFLLARQHLHEVGDLGATAFGQRLAIKLAIAGVVLLTAIAHTITSRSSSRPVLMVSRSLAAVTFLATLAVFYQASRLSL